MVEIHFWVLEVGVAKWASLARFGPHPFVVRKK